MLHQVNHLDLIFSRQVLFTNLLQIRKGRHAFGRLPGDVEPEFPFLSGCRGS
jgi:hypothetical protein